eukprot:7990648-Heterocapsa_arctica.AAC.1
MASNSRSRCCVAWAIASILCKAAYSATASGAPGRRSRRPVLLEVLLEVPRASQLADYCAPASCRRA